MGKVKDLQMLEEGYIKVTLRCRKDVDDYMLDLINQETNALLCIPKKRSVSTFLYDTRKYISLLEFLSLWKSSTKSFMQLFIDICKVLQYMEKQYPYVLHCNTIFLDETRAEIKVLILPIHEHYNEENDWSIFLQEILHNLQIEDDALIGWLYQLSQKKMLQAKDILQACEKRQAQPKNQWTEIYTKRKQAQQQAMENEQILQQYFMKRAFLYQGLSQEVESKPQLDETSGHSETVVLFSSSTQAYLDCEGKVQSINTTCVIGRNKDCDYILSSNAVSSHHAKIEWKDDRWNITDLNSSNGTMVNEKQIAPNKAKRLYETDVITIADSTLFFHTGTLKKE